MAFRAVLENPLAGLEGQVQAGEVRVFLLQFVDHPQRLQVVLEAAVGLHAAVQRVLTGVAEWRVPEIVCEADRLDQLLVQTETARHGPADLGDLERVGQPRAVVVALVVDEHLRLVLEAPERGAVDDPVPVALILAAIWMGRLGEAPAPAGPLEGRPGRQPRIRIDRHAGQ